MAGARPPVEGPRHQDPQLARRRHGQPAERRRRRARSTRRSSCPEVDLDAPAPDGSRQRLLELGPAGFAAALRAQTAARRHRHDVPRRAPVAARDPRAHQGPRRRAAARRPAHARAALRRGLGRRDLRRRAPLPRRGPVGAARRHARGAAEHRHPDAAARPQHGRLHAVPDRGHRCVRARGGGDRRRHLPHLRRPQRRRPDEARRSTPCSRPAPPSPRSRSATPATCSTPPRTSTRSTTTCAWPSRWSTAGRAHPGDQGHGRAAARRAPPRSSSTALRERFDLPVHVHTHDTAGGQLATLLAASRAGADAVDVASAPMAGTTSQPSLSALVAATAHTERDTGLEPAGGQRPRAVLGGRAPASTSRSSPGLPGPTGRVYRHEIPGGQLSNLRQQAIALGLGDRFEVVEDLYAAASDILGRPPKVTPSSKVVGDLALALAAAERRPGRLREEPGQVRHPGFGRSASWRASSATCRAAGPSRSAPRCSRAATSRSASRSSPPRRRRRSTGDVGRAARDPQPAAVRRRRRRRSSRSASSTATCRSLDTPDYLYGLRPGVEHSVTIATGREPVRRARGDRRGRRQGHAHGHDDPQRAAAPGVRARPQHHGREQGGREGRCRPGRAGRRAVLRRRHASRSPRATRSRRASRSRRSRR